MTVKLNRKITVAVLDLVVIFGLYYVFLAGGAWAAIVGLACCVAAFVVGFIEAMFAPSTSEAG